MKKWTDINNIIKNFTMLSQLGLSLIAPVLMCIAVCWWLTVKVGIGGWVYIPGFFFGMGGSFMVAYKLYLSVTGQIKKDKKKDKISFNKHQ